MHIARNFSGVGLNRACGCGELAEGSSISRAPDLPGESASPTHQRTRPAMRLTEPPTIATPNTYDKKAWESTVRRIRRSRTVVSDTW